MKLFSTLLILYCVGVVNASEPPALWSSLVKKIQTERAQTSSFQSNHNPSEDPGLALHTVQWQEHEHIFRLVLRKDQTQMIVSVKKPKDIAFSILENISLNDQSYAELEKLLLPYQPETVPTSNAQSGYTSMFEDDPSQDEKASISTAEVLSWNRLLKDAYQGNTLGSSSSSATPEGASEGMGQALSQAKMMNQCGGNNKTHRAHKRTLSDIAQALVMVQATQRYTDTSQDYQKQSQGSLTERLARLENVDAASLYADIQAEKRKLEKALSRDELSYIFTQEATDQNSLSLLQTLIEEKGRVEVLKSFQFVGRKWVIDPKTYSTFAKSPNKSFLYMQSTQKWALNPLLSSPVLYRKALVEMLWSYMQKQS